jgi:hypothetical protein
MMLRGRKKNDSMLKEYRMPGELQTRRATDTLATHVGNTLATH